LICDEIENFDDKLLHAAQQSDLLKKNLHATMQLTIPGREQKTATLSSSCSLWIAFPHTTRSKKKKIWRMCEADANCGPYSFSKHRQQKKSARSKKRTGSPLYFKFHLQSEYYVHDDC